MHLIGSKINLLKTAILLLTIVPFTFFTSCSQTNFYVTEGIKNIANDQERINSIATTLASRFPTPQGYKRPSYEKNSFHYYLTGLPLKPVEAQVYYFNGEVKPNKVHASVFDIDVGKNNLQQCADAVIRLRAEYLYAQKRFNEIHFNFTNGSRVDYTKWAAGYRLHISGNGINWTKEKEKDYSYKTFREYLNVIFSYAGTLSLEKELKKISIDSIQTGDVFIRGGNPGHAIIVVDVAIHNSNGKRIFMIAQSYMPAQSIHLLINSNNKELSPWYDISETDKLYSPEWTFEKRELRRF